MCGVLHFFRIFVLVMCITDKYTTMRRLLIVVLLLCVVITSCKRDKEPAEPVAIITLQTESDIIVPSEGGDIEILYTIEDESRFMPVGIECGDRWVSHYEAVTQGSIRLYIEPNISNAQRTTTVTLHCNTEHITLTITQLCLSDEMPKIVLTSNKHVELDRNKCSTQITYELQNADDTTSLYVNCDYWWISHIDKSQYGVVTVEVMPNYSGNPRSARILLKVGTSQEEVVVTQRADGEILFEAKELLGAYYGDQLKEGIGNYWIILCDNRFDEYGQSSPSSTYYRIDLYGEKYVIDDTNIVPIPEGVYTFDAESSCACGIFTARNSNLWQTDKKGNSRDIIPFEAGELVVERERITLTAIIHGEAHTVVYNDSGWLKNESSTQLYCSTLHEDYEVFLNDHRLTAKAYADAYQTPYYGWEVTISPNSGLGDELFFDIITTNYGTIGGIAGEYIGTTVIGGGIFYAGFMLGSLQLGSWYRTTYHGDMAPLRSGDLILKHLPDGNVSMTLRALDDRGNVITAEWSGEAELIL